MWSADSVKFTSGSGITPSPGPLPTAAPGLIGFYVIVTTSWQTASRFQHARRRLCDARLDRL